MATQILLPRKTIGLLMFVIILLLIGTYIVVYLPKANVIVSAAQTERTVEQEITLSSSQQDPDFVKFRLPANVVSAEAEKEKTFSREADTKFDDFAKGEVVLVNEQNEEQELLPKTHLRHEKTGVFFLTDTPVAIPAGGEVKMTVTAKEKGASGNVESGRFLIDKLAPSLQSSIYAKSSVTMTGGVAVEKPISDKELNSAKEELLSEAREEVRAELSTEAGGASIREDLMAFTEESASPSAEVGSKAISFTVKAKVVGKAFKVDDNDLLSLTVLKLREATDPEEEFLSYDPTTFIAELIRSDFERGEAIVKGVIKGSFATKIGPGAFNSSSLAGLGSEEVKERLQDFPGVGEVDVKLSPFWVKAVPSREGSVNIQINNSK